MAKSLTKEKEKLCHVEEIFQSLIEVKEEVSKKMEKLPPQFNLLENIRNKNSNQIIVCKDLKLIIAICFIIY